MATRPFTSIIARCNNYDAAETSRQIGRLAGLPISCTRLREKHGTPELLPLCVCDFGNTGARGGYATPLLHAAGFRHSWRAVLRDRDARARARPADVPGVRAIAEPAGFRARAEVPDLRVTAEATEDGVLVKGAPPHEWA